MTIDILKTSTEVFEWRNSQTRKVHFIPTMGGLHDGHTQLIKSAQKSLPNSAASVLVSVFVNPLQFGPEEDFASYPRNEDQDCQIAKNSGAQAIWLPSIEEVFTKGVDEHFKVKVPETLKAHLCGLHRKGHFDGVANVIIRLLALTKPDLLILGEKDWQQLIILRNLVQDLGLAVKIKTVATVREKNGLAISSRNQFLNPLDKEIAIGLQQELSAASKKFQSGKEISLNKIRSSLRQRGLKVEYLEVVDPHLLHPVKPSNKISLLAAAVLCGTTRLIDHTFLMKRKPIVAIDGPAGAGKSTVTKAFADKLGLIYLDTGSMYRAVTWLTQKHKIEPDNEEALLHMLKELEIKFEKTKTGEQKVLLNKKDVSYEIRTPEVTSLVSTVAAQKVVREALTAQQKHMGIHGGLVAEGRDIGTTVFPDAELKVFLTATAAERARRRAKDMQDRGFPSVSLKELETEIKQRDELDSTRKLSPLIQAKDAKKVITDGMTIEEVIDVLLELFRSKIPEEVWPSPTF